MRGKTRLAMAPGCARACVSCTRRWPRSRSRPAAGNVGFTSMSARMASVAGNFAAVERKLIEPLSLPTEAFTDVPSSCSAFDSDSASRVCVPSLSRAAVSDATACLPAGSNWSAPPRKVIEKEMSGRSCFSATMRSAPLASVLFVHAGTRSSGVFAGGGIFLRSSACCADGAMDSRTTAASVTHAFISHLPVSSCRNRSRACSDPAWPPDRACPSAPRSARRGRRSGTCWRPA